MSHEVFDGVYFYIFRKKLGLKPKPKSTIGKMTVAEAGAKGGAKTAATHGHEDDQEIGRKGGKKSKLSVALNSSV